MPRTDRTLWAFFALVVFIRGAPAQCEQWLLGPGAGTPNTNGSVYAIHTWDPDGPGPAPVGAVIGGSFTVAGTAASSNIAFWDGGAWRALGSGCSATVRALTVFNGDLIAAGDFTSAGGNPANRSPVGTAHPGARWAPA